jgi:tRNA threonylcarbamoyladenosine biosynthesis protein TsaB
MVRGHAEALVPMILRAMREAKVGFEEVDRLAVTVGPGTFTGLRIGLAAARGLALAIGAPVIGVTTLLAVARAVPTAERAGRSVLALLDTKRSEVYAQLFDAALRPLTEPAALALDDLRPLLRRGPVLAVGDAVPRLADRLQQMAPDLRTAAGPGLPDAAWIVRLAADMLAGEAMAGVGLPPEPLYLRPPDVHPGARAAGG